MGADDPKEKAGETKGAVAPALDLAPTERLPAASDNKSAPSGGSKWLDAIHGGHDAQVVGDVSGSTRSDKPDAKARSEGQKQLDEEKARTGYKNLRQGVYQINGPDGSIYQVNNSDANDPTVSQMKDRISMSVTPEVAKAVAKQVQDIGIKDYFSGEMTRHPLDGQQRSDFESMFKAFKDGDLTNLETVAGRYKNEPQRFAQIFTHLLGEQVLSGMGYDKQLVFSVNQGTEYYNGTFQATDGVKAVSVDMQKDTPLAWYEKPWFK